ncbi:hypothetical protein NEOLI_004353 [Neolecta irregularis DAH-3]|uniref:Uncharacterized protein n=1 Tax=Neolecta irregularis (strain DAH-3) TaxID=1198029 RepID=A0A1U7LKC8_NEOID|nr:hypothetical protein NEOLI_004353 [Neolecta irregularis DAH-3]|eukprot:OLL23116.1 hypothetical protein NEOLI_004353 [Neolecta irregularis DAH-3]
MLLDAPSTPSTTASSSNPSKPNKGAILRKSVDYIRYLKDSSEKERLERIRLEELLKSLSPKPERRSFDHRWDT